MGRHHSVPAGRGGLATPGVLSYCFRAARANRKGGRLLASRAEGTPLARPTHDSAAEAPPVPSAPCFPIAEESRVMCACDRRTPFAREPGALSDHGALR